MAGSGGGATALCIACQAGDEKLDLVRELVSRGANPAHRAMGGRTPLTMAVTNDQIETAKFLLT